MPELHDLSKAKITFIKERCMVSRNCKTGCRNCMDVCPASGIELQAGEIAFHEFNCQHCGACRAVCPSEAFTVKNLSFLNEICNLGEQELSIGCTLNEQNRQDFNVGCYALLTEGELVYLLSKKDTLTFCVAKCPTCRYSRGFEGFLHSFNLLRDLLIQKDKLRICNHDKKDEGVSRRLFFSWFKQKAVTAVAAALPVNETKVIPHLSWRRETFLLGLQNLSGELSRKMFVRRLEAHAACSGCGGCVTICPFNAFRLEDGKLSWQAKRCLNCGLCIKSCPEQALSYGGFVLQEEFCRVETLKEFVGQRCRSCGTYFQGETEQCAHCQSKSLSLEQNFDLCIEGF